MSMSGKRSAGIPLLPTTQTVRVYVFGRRLEHTRNYQRPFPYQRPLLQARFTSDEVTKQEVAEGQPLADSWRQFLADP